MSLTQGTPARWQWSALFAAVFALLITAVPASAQPFGSWLTLSGDPANGRVIIPGSFSLTPQNAYTFEAWVSISNNPTGEDCRSIAGKNYISAWWIGLCTVGGKPTLRSYLKGAGSAKNGGQIEVNRWTHIAVVFDGAHRYHYIDGELAATFDETGPLGVSAADMAIGYDESWPHAPSGAIDEVRLWSTARTEAQIRAGMSHPITAPETGLIAVWPLNGNASDIIGVADGQVLGTGTGFLTFPVAPNCGSTTSTSLCLRNRFSISARWRTDPAGTLTNAQAQVAGTANAGSGLFQFFSPDNWEVMVKTLDGCGLNNRYWVFSAATTNVFYRLEVLDVKTGTQKIYFNYPGPPAPAVTDTDALATCP
jgi:hypothetical protein